MEFYSDPKFGPESRTLRKHKGAWLAERFFPTEDRVDAVLNMNIRPTDILIVGFQKSGTTWLQEIVLQISCIKDPGLAAGMVVNGKRIDMEKSVPMVESITADLAELEKRPDPRILKYHLPYQLLPTAAQNGVGKIIYIARDVRDVAVSYFHFVQFITVKQYSGTVEDLCNEFLNDTVYNGPWLDHVKEYWTRRGQDNLLFTTYEQLKRNPEDEIRKIGEFLGVGLTQAQIGEIVVSASFEKMKKNDAVNYSWLKEVGRADPNKDFMRKGVSGDWKNHISEELGDAMDKKFLQPLKECGLVFGDQ